MTRPLYLALEVNALPLEPSGYSQLERTHSSSPSPALTDSSHTEMKEKKSLLFLAMSLPPAVFSLSLKTTHKAVSKKTVSMFLLLLFLFLLSKCHVCFHKHTTTQCTHVDPSRDVCLSGEYLLFQLITVHVGGGRSGLVSSDLPELYEEIRI